MLTSEVNKDLLMLVRVWLLRSQGVARYVDGERVWVVVVVVK